MIQKFRGSIWFALLLGLFCITTTVVVRADDEVSTVRIHYMNLKTNQDIQTPTEVQVTNDEWSKNVTVPQITGFRRLQGSWDYDRNGFKHSYTIESVSDESTIYINYYDTDVYVYYVRPEDEAGTITIHWMNIQNNTELTSPTVVSGRSETSAPDCAVKQFSGYRIIDGKYDVAEEWGKKATHEISYIYDNKVELGYFDVTKPKHIYVYYIKQVKLTTKYVDQNGKSIKANKVESFDITSDKMFTQRSVDIKNYESDKRYIEWKGLMSDKTITFKYKAYITTKFDVYEKGAKKKKKTITCTDLYGTKTSVWVYLDEKHEYKDYKYTATTNRTIKVELRKKIKVTVLYFDTKITTFTKKNVGWEFDQCSISKYKYFPIKNKWVFTVYLGQSKEIKAPSFWGYKRVSKTSKYNTKSFKSDKEIVFKYNGTARNVKVVENAFKYLGVKYKWGGSSLKTGADCSGFVMAAYAKYKVSLPHSAWEMSRTKKVKSIKRKEVRVGDLMINSNPDYRKNTKDYLEHVRLYAGNGFVIQQGGDDYLKHDRSNVTYQHPNQFGVKGSYHANRKCYIRFVRVK